MPSGLTLRLLALAACLPLTACKDGEPKGQVLARVNGEEITISELNHEARVRNLALEGDNGVRNALLRELIDRKLLVQEARARKLNRLPDFVLAERRAGEILLAQQLLESSAGSNPRSQEAIADFIAGHPLSFGGRVTGKAVLISLPSRLDPALRQRLLQVKDPSAIAATLQQAGLSSTRSEEDWDSADPLTPLARGEVPPKAGQPFLLERSGTSVIGVLLDLVPQPVPREQWNSLAAAMMDRAEREERMNAHLRVARAEAKITHQKSFEPR